MSAGASQFQQQMLGVAAVGVRFPSTPEICCPPSITAALPYINGIMKCCQTLCFDSYGHARESFPPRLEKVTAELRLCHQRPISDCSATGGAFRSPVGCSPAEAALQPHITAPHSHEFMLRLGFLINT